jgi:hypothetical protein
MGYCGVMKKLFDQLSLVMVFVIFLAACTGRDATTTERESGENFITPLSKGLPVYTEVDEAFFSQSNNAADSENSSVPNGSLSLFSLHTAEDVLTPSELAYIFHSDDNIVLALNTVDSIDNKANVSLLVKDDDVYSVDHNSNELRKVRHFTSQICELIPIEIVRSSVDGEGVNKSETLQLYHDEKIYVVTADSKDEGDPCVNPTAEKSYYELPLSYKFNSSVSDDTTTTDLRLVSEALARSAIIYGWVDDPAVPGNSILDYGYLGYSVSEAALKFFDNGRLEQWSQSRFLETFSVVSLNSSYTPAYLFKLTQLEHYQYMLQLGLDIFVFDSSSAIFAKNSSDVESILVDRTFKASPLNVENVLSDLIQPVDAYFDDDDLVLLDDSKIFNYKYVENITPPSSVSHQFIVKKVVSFSIDQTEHLNKRPFSQFDLQPCDDEDAACQSAHDIESASWQLITACDSSFGCELNNTVGDYCETLAEKQVSQSDEALCTPSNYLHISELNLPGNDAEFRGFIQYGADYINDLEVILHDNSLFITARMKEKEVLVKYHYQASLNVPKPSRETVLFGARKTMQGLEVLIEKNNLFLNTLLPGSTRSNECYKNYQQVECDLGNFTDKSTNRECTGQDLAGGLCFSSFREFESSAVFCSAESLSDETCNDDSIAVEGEAEDAKWLKVFDQTNSEVDARAILLLKGDHLSALESKTLDEGILSDPELFLVNASTGSNIDSLGILFGQVERVVGGVLYRSSDSKVDGYVDVISHEVVQATAGSGNSSRSFSQLEKHALMQLPSASNASVNVPRIDKVGTSQFTRFDTSTE